jgi:hypothetical protein
MPLLAWDADGNVIATLDDMVVKDDLGRVLGHVDFEAHEVAGKPLTDIWVRSDAEGSGTWPEWLDRPLDFKVEKRPRPGSSPHIRALVHRDSGYKRERADIERAIADRIDTLRSNLPPEYADDQLPEELLRKVLADIRGTPTRPLLVDDEGRTRARPVATRPRLTAEGPPTSDRSSLRQRGTARP